MTTTSGVTEGNEKGLAVTISAISMIVVGLAAIAVPGLAGIGISLLAGVALLLAGLAYGSFAFAARGTGTFLWRFLAGAVFAITGLYLIVVPAVGLTTLTLIVAVVFAIEGIAEIAAWLTLRGLIGSSYLLINGILSLLLAAMIGRSWPYSSDWAIGTLIGINLITSGITRLAFAPIAQRTIR